MRGADEAYTALFNAEYPRVRRTISAMVGGPAAAEDITQDAFVQLFLHWPKVGRYDRPDAWVRRVAVRLAVKHMKRESRRQVLERRIEVTGTQASGDADLAAAIQGLPARQRAVLVLFYYEDRPMKEIAQMLGISEATGFVHLHRARRHLGQLLGEEVGDVARP